MTNRKLQFFDEYRYGPRSVLKPGDQFRVGGGPVYVTDDGVEHTVADRGRFTFRRYCVQGAQKWIEAFPVGGGGIVLLWVGKAAKSPIEPNLKRKPYKIRKVADRKRKPKKVQIEENTNAATAGKRKTRKAKLAVTSAEHTHT